MARLIDADRFECIGFQATGEQRYDDGFADGLMFMAERIDSAPTVDAIPVEWLREKIKEHTNDDGWQDYLANSFGLCIEEWKKEQEART